MPNVEDRKLTPKENYLRMLTGREMEWIPLFTMGFPVPGEVSPMSMIVPSLEKDPHDPTAPDNFDLWGVEWVGEDNAATGGMIMPKTYDFVLDDITKWHDVVKAPDYSDVDWEMVCKKDMESNPFNPNRETTALCMNLYVGAFQQLMALMGFTEGLIAMIEEPEEAKACMEYINKTHVDIAKKCMPYIQPDIIYIMDDTCSAKAPFISEDIYRDMCLPCYKYEIEQLAEPYGLPVAFHNCGTAANYIGIAHEEAGVNAWDPAQSMNDLVAFREKWHSEIAVCGGWEPRGHLLDDDITDEEILGSVKDAIDFFGKDYAFAFAGRYMGAAGDEEAMRKSQVIMEFAQPYCNHFYD